MAITPRLRSAAVSAVSLVSAPRSLNELVTCRFSYLTNTSAPVNADSRGAGSIGVRSTWPAMVRRASWISASVTVKVESALTRLPYSRFRGAAATRAGWPCRLGLASGRGSDHFPRERRRDASHDRRRTATDRVHDRGE